MDRSKIAGFTYKAENYCPHCAAHAIAEAGIDPLITHMAVVLLHDGGKAEACTELLEMAAKRRGITLSELDSYDSDDFPKPFTAEEEIPESWCSCLRRFSDGVQLKPFTVFGHTAPDGTDTGAHVVFGWIPDELYSPARDATETSYVCWISRVAAEDTTEAVRCAEEAMIGEDIPAETAREA